MNKTKPTKIACPEPLEGWQPNSRFGMQRLDDTPAGRLVRLEDVAVWLAQRKPRKAVIFELFFPLIASWENAESLFLLKAEDYPIPILDAGRVSPAAAGFWQFLPSVDSGTVADDLARGIRDGWERAWPALSDPTTDPDWTIARTIARNKERSEMLKAKRLGLVPDADPEPWPDDDFLMEQLRRVAIPVSKAYELWGWGHAPAEVVQLVPVPAADLEPKPIKTYSGLKAFRVENPGAPWTHGMRAALAQEEERRKNRPGAAGVRKKLGEELGCSDKRIGELIREHKEAIRSIKSKRIG